MTEPGGKEKRVADLSNMRRLHIDYHQQKLHTQPPSPPHDMHKVDQYCHQQKGKSTLLLKLKRSASRESALFRMLANMLNEIMQIAARLIGSPNLSQARLYVVKEMWRRRRQYFQGCRDNHEVLCGKAYEASEDVLQYRHLTIRKHFCSSSFRNKSHFQAL